MRLDEALFEFNTLRIATAGDDVWTARLDRLAQASFGATEHFIVYGSLSPGAPNHGRVAPLAGDWETGWVEGEREQVGWGAELGYPALRWRPGGPRVAAHLFRSLALPAEWAALDRFEGAAYCRILVPFYTDEGLRAVGFLYAAASQKVTSSHPEASS